MLSSGKIADIARRLFFVLFLLLFTFPLFPQAKLEEVNNFQKWFLESQIQTEVRKLLLNWREERYIEGLYEQGDEPGKKIVSAEKFAQEMVSKDWQIASSKPEIEKIVFQNLIMADVYLTLRFSHVIDPLHQIVKKVVLRANAEKNSEGKSVWKFDLIHILNLPY